MTATSPDRLSSHTALTVALLRAAHQLLDGAPRILDDSVVLDLLPASEIERIRAQPEQFQAPAARGLRSHVLVRSRFAEDRLAEAARRGLRQAVVLGAGFDTFAFRQPDWARSLRIFEIDRPATQSFKRERLTAAGIAVPDNVRLVPIDLEVTPLADGLRAAGIALDEPVFFSWLGVTMYLSAAAVDVVLRTVAALPASSEIVFTFVQPLPSSAGDATDAAIQAMAHRAAAAGEPWITFFEPDELTAKLRDIGFAQVQLLGREETEVRYFRGRADGLPVPERVSIAAAVR